MKLLFDENISYRLVYALQDLYPYSTHVRDVSLLGAEDERIWAYAAAYGFLLVSKDTDFYQRSLLYGVPPKVIWLRVDNAPTSRIVTLLRERYVMIRRFAEDSEASFLPLRLA